MTLATAAKGATRRERWAWYMYDFGNSAYASVVLLAVYSAYFRDQVVGGTEGDRMWGWGGRKHWRSYLILWAAFDENNVANLALQNFDDGRQALAGYLHYDGTPSLLQRAAVDVDWDPRRWKTIARVEAQEDSLPRFESLMLSVVESLDGKGNVKKEEREIYRRHTILGAFYDELIEKNGRLLDDKAFEKEKKQKDKFVREVQKRIARGEPPQPEDGRQVRFDREFISRYRLELVGTEVVRGRGCWIVYIEPRDGDLPVRRRIDCRSAWTSGCRATSRESAGSSSM